MPEKKTNIKELVKRFNRAEKTKQDRLTDTLNRKFKDSDLSAILSNEKAKPFLKR